MNSKKWLLLIPLGVAMLAQPNAARSDDSNGVDDGPSVVECLDKMEREADKAVARIEERTSKAVEKINKYLDEGKPDKAQQVANKAAVGNVRESQKARDKICAAAHNCKEIRELEHDLIDVQDTIEEVSALIQLNPDDKDLAATLQALLDERDVLLAELEEAEGLLAEGKSDALTAVTDAQDNALVALIDALGGDDGGG